MSAVPRSKEILQYLDIHIAWNVLLLMIIYNQRENRN